MIIPRNRTNHMIGVAEYMYENAEKYHLDPNTCYIVGLLHDIGYLEGKKNHEHNGASMLEYLLCVSNKDVLQAIEYHGKSASYVKYVANEPISPLLTLLWEADLSVDVNGNRVSFDERLKDIETRLIGTEYEDAIQTVKENIEYLTKEI